MVDDQFVLLNSNQKKIIASGHRGELRFEVQKYHNNGWATVTLMNNTINKKVAYLNYADANKIVAFIRGS